MTSTCRAGGFGKAVCLNSSQFQLSRVAGPVLAGSDSRLLPRGCFISQLSFVAVELLELSIRQSEDCAAHSGKDQRALWQDLIDGLATYAGGREFFAVVAPAFTSLFGGPYITPSIFARDIFSLGATGLAWMWEWPAPARSSRIFLPIRRRQTQRWFVLGGSLRVRIVLVRFPSLPSQLSMMFLFGVVLRLSLTWRYKPCCNSLNRRDAGTSNEMLFCRSSAPCRVETSSPA